eukprot:TRINITY_DN3338_c0_g1_i1.p1 TRINITY_DN3338_c0_g1~~TRINITY_DN3338_c0_g1_i1.p1  ORF type:complete len:403 (-),score=87.23 TRINITY_DN3338_c0_g1_i1:25-1203(-)
MEEEVESREAPTADGSLFAIKTQKHFVKDILQIIKSHSLYNPQYKVSPGKNQNEMCIPLRSPLSPQDQQSLLPLLSQDPPLVYSLCLVQPSELLSIKSVEPAIETLKKHLREKCKWPEEALCSVPAKWTKYGDVVVLEAGQPPKGDPLQLLEAFQVVLGGVRCVLIHEGPVSGELRKPKISSLTPLQSSITIHKENGIKYKFDTMKVMFAPGNGTERIRIAEMKINPGEVVLDMFAGIGYFSLPLVKNNFDRISKHIALEKNPVSFGFLQENILLNGLSSKMECILGDNREVAQQYVGQVDRILMGYLPNTKDFLPRALTFCKPTAILHYHHLSTKPNFKTEAIEDIREAVQSSSLTCLIKIELVNYVKVKSYAPKIYHCVADVRLVQSEKK